MRLKVIRVTHRDQHADGNRQIATSSLSRNRIGISGHLSPIHIGDDVEYGTFLLDVCRGQIDRQAFLGHLEPGLSTIANRSDGGN